MLSRGSEWRRWEPHIHAPGTAVNNQFTGADAWDRYIEALEGATPQIEAIAVTDYYVLETYKEVLTHKAAGRLPDVKLIFPNVEVRLDVAAKSGFVNLHLFVSPEDADHLDQVERLLARLQFDAYDDRFNCTAPDLIRLGKRADQAIVDDRAALAYGANQFKVNFNQLREVLKSSGWAKENILVAVAGGTGDGTSGVREAADRVIREEIEKFADIVFGSSDAQREFWLGQRALSREQICDRYRGLKPCLHGSDAHKIDDVASPFGDRFSWIKGGVEFDALRQACIDPENRAFVGATPPKLAMPSQVIAHVEIFAAPWAKTPSIPLNPGLVAIIGARGSGKTALADMIAAGCEAMPASAWDERAKLSPSFLARAKPLIGSAKVRLDWQAGDPSDRALDGSDIDELLRFPRARYLSQQFVEDLCSSSGIADGLLQEIERVIFQSHPFDERDGAVSFDELLERRANRHRLARRRETEAVTQISESISVELEKEKALPQLVVAIAQKAKALADATADRSKLVAAGSEERVRRHTEISAAADKVRAALRERTNQRDTFVAMQDEVGDLRRNQAPATLRQTQARHAASRMTPEQWSAFLLDYSGEVDDNLRDYIAWSDQEIAKIKGAPIPPPSDPNAPLIADDAVLESLTLGLLDAEMGRLERLVSADRQTQQRYAYLTTKINTETAALEAMRQRETDYGGARERARQLQQDRVQAYQRAFEALDAEQDVLIQLYKPLMDRLAAASGTLNKLSFTVARVADIDKWASVAESGLIDLRKQGPFRGKGALVEVATEKLLEPWQTGTPAQIAAAMADFRDAYQADLLAHSPVPQAEQANFRAWAKQFAHWLYSTDHIEIRYGIEYDGVDIRKLSPGTRGIVLLLLYLVLDDNDDTPLIIDQPEENLDPKSVFDELVGLFIQAKSRRQVIMVTHNANLVINTDADQIIIAEVGPHLHGGLPPITYVAGGLENAEIRKAVCDILEGGEHAFKERARRLRVRLGK